MTTVERTDWTAVAERLSVVFAERAAEHDSNDSFVAANYADLRAERVISAAVPSEFGGGGADLQEICDFLRILGRGCSSTALALSMHMHQVAVAAWRWRNDNAPVEGILRRIANEQCVLVTSGGSDWLASSGKAERDGDGFRITARKVFASGVPEGTIFQTSAVYDDPSAGPTVLHFALQIGADGLRVLDTWRTLGMRGTGSHDVMIEGVYVPDASVVARRPAGKWHPLFHLISMIALPIVYSVYVGIAEAARDLAVADAMKRRKNDPDTQMLAGEMENQLRLSQIALQSAIDLGMTAKPSPQTTSETLIRRTLIANGAIGAVEKAMAVTGGAGYFRSNGLERLFRDVQAARYHPLPEKPQTRLTGRVILGVDLDD